MNYKLIGKRIRKWRREAGYTQEELAELADLSAVYISNIETARKKPSLESLVSICDAVGVTVNELLSGNQYYDNSEYQSDIDLLLSDCTKEEKRLIYEIILNTKNTLRSNDWELREKKRDT